MPYTKNSGYTLIEIIIVLSILISLISISVISIKYFKQKSIYRIANTIVSNLNYAKFLALTRNVEHQLRLKYDQDTNLLTLILESGDSNIGSNYYEKIYKSNTQISIIQGYELITNNTIFNFNPNGTLGARSGSILIKPVSNEKTQETGMHCAKIVVSPFGRIRLVKGKWNFSIKDIKKACKGFSDKQENLD